MDTPYGRAESITRTGYTIRPSLSIPQDSNETYRFVRMHSGSIRLEPRRQLFGAGLI